MLALSGEITGEALERYGDLPDAALERVHAVETAEVDYLDEAGRALLVRVVVAAYHRGQRVRLPSPSRSALDALCGYGVLDPFEQAPCHHGDSAGQI